jgi:hypothetical protein
LIDQIVYRLYGLTPTKSKSWKAPPNEADSHALRSGERDRLGRCFSRLAENIFQTAQRLSTASKNKPV